MPRPRKSKQPEALEASLSQTARRFVLGTSDAIIIAIAIGFVCFTYLALISFAPEDPSWLNRVASASGGTAVRNLGGKVGAELAGLLVAGFGWAGWGIPLVIGRIAVMRIRRRRYPTIAVQTIAGIGLCLVVASMLALATQTNDGRLGGYALSGGWLGQLFGTQVLWKFLRWGAWIPLLTFGGLLFVFVGGWPALRKTSNLARDAGRYLRISLNRLSVRRTRIKREKEFAAQEQAAKAAEKKAQAAGLNATLPDDTPAYSESLLDATGTQTKKPSKRSAKKVEANKTATAIESTATQSQIDSNNSPTITETPTAATITKASTITGDVTIGDQSAPAFLRGSEATQTSNVESHNRKPPKSGFDSVTLGAGDDPTLANEDGTFKVVRKEIEEVKPAKGQLSMPLANTSNEFTLPSVNLLDDQPKSTRPSNDEVYQAHAKVLEAKLKDFNVRGVVEKAHAGPVITVFEFRLAPGTRVNKLTQLEDDLALAMSAQSVRISRFPNRDVMGIEVPSQSREIVTMREIVLSENFTKSKFMLPFAIGKTVFGDPYSTDIAKMPHLLMAGATGAGKSVGINTLIMSLLFTHTPDDLKLFMVDPKMLELSKYNGIPHMGYPVVTDSKKAVGVLRLLVREMEERYELMMKAGVRNVAGYIKRRKSGKLDPDEFRNMPYMVCVIDELADLMMVARKDVEEPIARLAQKARAAGIHLILATQRPSVDVVTGLIKSNFPARISFKVSARVDSKTILDTVGAQNLLGMGDMLFLNPSDGTIHRVHGCFVSDDEVDRVCDFWREQGEPANLFSDEELESAGETEEQSPAAAINPGGSLYEQAVGIAIREQAISISRLQRVLSIGYNKAANLIEQMEQEGVVGPAAGAGKKREVLIEPHELSPTDATPGALN